MIDNVFAIIDWSKTRTLSHLVEKLTRDSIFADEYQSEIVIDKPEICVGVIHQPNTQSGYWNCGSREIVLHGNLCQEIKIDGRWENTELSTIGKQVFDGVYNLMVWCDRAKSLLITSDYLSIKPLYYWRQDEVTVISSSLKAFRLLDFIPRQLNPQVLASTLALSHPLSDDTLIAGVKTLPINTTAIFRREKMDIIPRPGSRGDVNFQSTETELIQDLDNILEQSLASWLGQSSHSLIALSGGLDSRILLGYLKRSGTQITAATWGEPGSDDFKLGVELAQATETEYLTHILTENSAISETDLKFPGWWTESFSVNNVPFYWRGWIDLLQTQQLPVIHGFLGGPLGGGRISKWGISPHLLGREVDAVVMEELSTWGNNASASILLECATPEFKSYLTEGISSELIGAMEQIDQPYTYQRLMCLDFYYRQRRYLGNAISKIIGTFLPTVLPFYTRKNLDFVLQLPLELISGRKIFRKLLLEQFPTLANFQEADKGKLPVYANSISKYLDILLENRYMWYLFPKLKPRNSALVFSLLLEKHLPIFIDNIVDSGNILNNYVDVPKLVSQLQSGKISPQERGEIMRLFNICTFINRYFNQLE